MRSREWIVTSFLLLAGCAGDQGPSPARVTERDSAGIRIVENAIDTAAMRAGWTMSVAPVVEIGGIEADELQQLYRVSGGLRLDDGRIVIASRGSSDIRVFSADGTLARVHGREGDGPGEYRMPALAGRGLADSLIVYDASLRRITVLTPDGGAIRSVELGTEGGGFPMALGTLGDGRLAMGGGMAFTSEEGLPSGFVRPTSRHVIVSSDGSVEADFGDIPAVEMWAEIQGSSFRARPIAFGKFTVAEPVADRLWIGTGERWEVRAYRSDRSLERIVRFNRDLAPVTRTLTDEWIEEELEDIEDLNEARDERARLASLPVPDVIAPYRVFLADRLDNLWIGETMLPGEESRTWTIIDSEGKAVGRLTMPARTSPLDIGTDYVLAVTTDELDVESLTVWRLDRPAK
ncbi:MAG TPA: hypothetical protein VMM79_12465 [Longimicrobiales bacterium]|nr:hypothetical protein [Longimicrobiales bacterium]